MDTETATVLWTTLRVALTATLIAAPVGIGLGHLLARRSFPGKSVLETIVALPLVLPPTAIGYLLLSLFSRSGILGEESLGFDPDVLFTWKGAVLASSVMSLPLITRTARAAFEQVDPRLELMMRSLGISRSKTFLKVTIPLARRGLMAAATLGFGRALGEFGATVIVAGNIPGRTQTLALAIFNEIQLGHSGAALHLVGITVLIAFAIIWSAERLQRERPLSPPTP